ncbi:MAG: tryptophanase [Planctomycetes bacterium]|nr:tryptophanase [Planctomycetota bacterium]NOG55490.1 tryptophanase [Planctomycetota bacterium]
MRSIIEPFRIKVVEPIRITTQAEREEQLRKAHYNLFLIPAEYVLIDLLTDSGTGAMSSDQWAGIMRGDESYAGARSFYRFYDRMQEITGFEHILPTHQGRASERLLFELIGGPDKVVPNNAHFDTTRANIEHSGAKALDLLTEEGQTPSCDAPFKGNLNIEALRALISEVGAERIPAVFITVTCNNIGGQPVSMENLRQARAVCDEFGLPLFLDACRFAENAYFIKMREPGYEDKSVAEIVREMFDLADGATISAKKDGLVNIGGVLLLRDKTLFQNASNQLILTEGYVTYGGLAGRDLEAMAQGFAEVLHEDYLQYRIRSTAYVGEKLLDAGVSIVRPPGGHAIYIDAAAFCPHIPTTEFPGQGLAIELYRHVGIRSCEIGSIMFEGNAPMELVRLAIPRRVYTQSHMDYTCEGIIEVFENRDRIRGVKIIEQPPALRHFTAKFDLV